MATWPEWNTDTEWVRLDGPFQTGGTGMLKPKGGPKVRFVLDSVVPEREFVDVSLLLGARLTFRHDVEPRRGGARRCHRQHRRPARAGVEAGAGQGSSGFRPARPRPARRGLRRSDVTPRRGSRPARDADDSPGFLLWQVTNKWQAAQRAALKPFGLTHVQFVLLASLTWLDSGGP